jgi:hypothetical protein
MITQYKPADNRALAGKVSTQEIAMSHPIFQRTIFTCSPAPIPIIEELATWVVLTGLPSKLALMITITEEN